MDPNTNSEASNVQPTPQPRHIARRFAIGVIAVLVIGAGSVIAAYTIGHRADTGLSGCQAVKTEIVRKTGGNAYTAAIYHQQRTWFSKSTYADLRQAGTVYVDDEWQAYQEVRSGDATSVDYGALVHDQAALALACANHGTKLPPVGSTDS